MNPRRDELTLDGKKDNESEKEDRHTTKSGKSKGGRIEVANGRSGRRGSKTKQIKVIAKRTAV